MLHYSCAFVINFQEKEFDPYIGLNIGSGSSFVQRRGTSNALQEDKNTYCNGTCYNICFTTAFTNQPHLFLYKTQFFGILCFTNRKCCNCVSDPYDHSVYDHCFNFETKVQTRKQMVRFSLRSLERGNKMAS